MKYVVAIFICILLSACGSGGGGFDGMNGSYVSTDGRTRVTFAEGEKFLEVKYRKAENGRLTGEWFFGFKQIAYQMKDGSAHFHYPGGSDSFLKKNDDGTLVDSLGEIYVKQ